MIPVLSAVYDALLERAVAPSHAARARSLREAFFARTGRFPPDHPESGARDAAAWEDALVRGGLATLLARELDDDAERETASTFRRAQRGAFVFRRHHGALIAEDLWSNAEFLILPRDDVAREVALDANASGDRPLCQARLLPGPDACVVLPGAVFHPADARAAIERTLAVARERRLSTDAVMDGLLKMEHTWRSLTRVKIAYAYRPEALPGSGAPPNGAR
ncbi:MAG: hypothetical protein OZ921_04160 [Sorangiineae bacterium]|nr:hypothetical protein [Sorangiineae bacterium]